jgi:hypothetical protein
VKNKKRGGISRFPSLFVLALLVGGVEPEGCPLLLGEVEGIRDLAGTLGVAGLRREADVGDGVCRANGHWILLWLAVADKNSNITIKIAQ